MKYRLCVIDNAFEFLRYNAVDIKEAIQEDVSFLGDIQNGSVYDRFTEDLHSRDYSWMEAAGIIENCKNEEADASLWFGQTMERTVQVCAIRSFANDVWELAQELYTDVLDEYEVRFDVVTEGGDVISEEFDDELDAEDFIEKLECKDDLAETYEFGDACDAEEFLLGLEVRETSNIEEIWADFLKEYENGSDMPE